MKLRIAETVSEKISEADIQKAFEDNLEAIDEGLSYVASYLPIGTGIIDVLAVDEDKNAVIIEFKKAGDFDEDALIQLMNYYSWFVTDENHKLYLENVIRKIKPEIDKIEDIRLIAVVSEVSDRVKNACWALEPPIKLVSYSLSRDSSGDIVIHPVEVLDTSVGGETIIKPPKTEEDHLKEHESFRAIYHTLKESILSDIDPNVKFNYSPQNYIGVVRRRTFLAIKFQAKWVRLDVLVKPKDVNFNSRVIDYGPNSEWSYIILESPQQIDEALIEILKVAYEKAG